MSGLRAIAAAAESLSDSQLFEALHEAVRVERLGLAVFEATSDVGELREMLAEVAGGSSVGEVAASLPARRKARAIGLRWEQRRDKSEAPASDPEPARPARKKHREQAEKAGGEG